MGRVGERAFKDGQEKGQEVKQYVIKCGEQDKFLLIYVIFKLKLVKGKCIIFVHDVDRSYHLKLYLEQYGSKSCQVIPLNLDNARHDDKVHIPFSIHSLLLRKAFEARSFRKACK